MTTLARRHLTDAVTRLIAAGGTPAILHIHPSDRVLARADRVEVGGYTLTIVRDPNVPPGQIMIASQPIDTDHDAWRLE